MSENVKFALKATLVMSISICLLVTFLRVTENYIWNRIFMLSTIYASMGSFLPQPMKQRSLDHQNLLQLLWKSFLFCSVSGNSNLPSHMRQILTSPQKGLVLSLPCGKYQLTWKGSLNCRMNFMCIKHLVWMDSMPGCLKSVVHRFHIS